MEKHSRPITILTLAIVSIGGLWYLMTTTTPDELGPISVGIFFLFIYVVLNLLVVLVLLLIEFIRGVRKPISSHILDASALSLPPVMLLAINTIRSVSLVDTVLAVIFGLVLLFYLRRR